MRLDRFPLQLPPINDQFQNRFGRLVRECDLTPSQSNVLRILRGEGKPMPCLEIGERMIQVVPAMTGLVDRLEKLEFVRRERCTQDGRVDYIELTVKAKQLLDKMDAPVNELQLCWQAGEWRKADQLPRRSIRLAARRFLYRRT